MEDKNEANFFVLAAEESLGYLAGDFVRDKDAAIASLLVCEMTSWLKDQGKTIPEFLDEIYRSYGYYKNVQHLIELPGKSGFEIMKTVMRYLQKYPPTVLADRPLVGPPVDRLGLAGKDRMSADYNLRDAADMISFVLSEDARTRVTARPSGTEPKLKYYVQHYAPLTGDLMRTKEDADASANQIAADIITWCTAGVRELASVQDRPSLLEDWRTAVAHRRVI